MFNKYTKEDFDWRLNLKKGDIIDVCDTSNVWYNSIILDTRTTVIEAKEIKEVFVGLILKI